jgi:PiT family inorganic phosphate transporter
MDGIYWNKVILVFASLFDITFLGIITGYLLMRLSRFFFAKTKMSMARADRFYKHMQILSSSWVSFSHGSNDATKVMGIVVIYLAAYNMGWGSRTTSLNTASRSG